MKKMPRGKFKRTVVGTGTAAKVGGKVLKYLVKKPFLSDENRSKAKQELSKETASTIFQTLTLLKGTALKIAQFLSMELDLLPDELRDELSKSYNSVPPLNRAIVRKILDNQFKKPFEKVFENFDLKAFAAASLGQVHKAYTHDGDKIAVKLQYPGVKNTIKSDLKLVKTVVRPLSNASFVLPMLDEIEEKLIEETDYIKESENQSFFEERLKIESVKIPKVYEEYSGDVIIASEYIEGVSLDIWIKSDPKQEDKDRIATILYEIFIRGLYELNCIHADPNPGNFIITKDLKVGLIDFGCIKRLNPEFLKVYIKLNKTILMGDQEYTEFLDDLNLLKKELAPKIKENIFKIMVKIGRWYNRFYKEEYFDFSKNKDIFHEPQEYFKELAKYRNYFRSQPDFVFLDRTRYGLYRIFEQMQVKIKIRNKYEWSTK